MSDASLSETSPAVLFVHNEYRQRGGEEDSVRDEANLLRRNGHRVSQLVVSNDEVRPGLSTALQAVWSPAGRRLVRDAIRQHDPDVVHFHNTFPMLSPAVYGAAKSAGKIVIQTVHNYRMACVNGLLFRDGVVCTDCVGQSPLAGALHACYRDSYGASSATAGMLMMHRLLRTYLRHVDLFFAVSPYVLEVLVASGIPANRIVVSDHFVPVERPLGRGTGGYAIFAGRLSAEKGVDVLLRAWTAMPNRPPLRIAGDGPLASLVLSAAETHSDLSYLGWLDRATMLDQLANASVVVLPSVFPEPAGRVLLDAMSVGTPVIASNLGGPPSIVGDGEAGILLPPGNTAALAKALEAFRDGDQLARRRSAAAARYRSAFCPEVAYARIVSYYAFARTRRLNLGSASAERAANAGPS